MVRDIDNTREKIGIREMDTSERKKLLKLFTEHGGKVVDQDITQQPKKPIQRQHSSQNSKDTSKKLETRKVPPKEGLTSQKFQTKPLAPGTQKIQKSAEKKASIFGRIKIQLRGFQFNLFTLGGNKFKNTFIRSVQKPIRERFIDISLALNSILLGEVSVINEIKRLSTGKSSTFYEVLVRLRDLYDEKEYLAIAKVISNKSIPKKAHIPLFKQFLKKLYILGQYRSICKMCIEKAILIQGKHNRVHRDVIQSMIDQLRADIDVILGDFLEEFHIIVCKMTRTFFPLFSPSLDEFLEISEKDRIGYITLMEKKAKMEQIKREKALFDEQRGKGEFDGQEIIFPAHIKRGIPLIRETIERYERLHRNDSDNIINLIDKNDSMFKAALLLDIFDNEYSFILTTGKVSFNIDYREQKKINIKKDLGNAYLVLSEAWEAVKEYTEILEEINDIGGNFRYSPYQQSVMIKTLEKKRLVLKRNAMRKIALVMKMLEEILQYVITDYNAHKRLLQNPEEVLYFDKNIDREKGVDGKKVIEAIFEAFLFSSTFTFLFNLNELSGNDLI